VISKYRKLIRWGASGLITILAIIYFNGALYCYWAAGGPPTPNPELWIKKGNEWLGISVVLIIMAIIITYLFRPKQIKENTGA
jgi:hypothetical protein